MPPESLSAIFLTHWHYDHCSDILPLIFRLQAVLKPGERLSIYVPEDPSSPIRSVVRSCPQMMLHDVHPGDVVTVGDVLVRVHQANHPVPAVMLRIEHQDHVLCYTGDTNQVEGFSAWCHQADLLMGDGLFPQSVWTEEKPHLSASLLAQQAREAGVKRLVVTHLNPLYDPNTLQKEARASFITAEMAQMGARYQIG